MLTVALALLPVVAFLAALWFMDQFGMVAPRMVAAMLGYGALAAAVSLAAGGGWDGLVRVWNAETGNLLATLLQPPGGWLSVSPTGEVAGSSELMTILRWKSGGTAP